ncbi:MAG TPA: LysR family transcriptional regulator, partial [Xanthomonadaceae bacterium]|nr:LysR family transcriptional regulator [Xanthomonadaceae bacterium]
DAGIRLAESVPQDMVAVPIGADLRLVVVASPEYLAARGTPLRAEQLEHHDTIRLRLSHGGLYRWELEQDGHVIEMDPPGRLVLTEMRGVIAAARAGLGLAFLSEWHIARDLADGRLVRVLEHCCPPFPGLRLYYPGHRHVPAGLQALVQVIREHNDAVQAARAGGPVTPSGAAVAC